MVKTIGNPLTWSAEALGAAGGYLADTTGRIVGEEANKPPSLRDMSLDDIREALKKGFEDFTALRSDVIFIVILYPIIGICLAVFAFNTELAPYLFPIASGFALIGPIAAVGLYEMSRRREVGLETDWRDAFTPFKSSALGPLVVIGVYLVTLFSLWLVLAGLIFSLTMGSAAPEGVLSFFQSVLTSPQGWAMILLGIPVGAIFAAVVLASTVVSIPLILDREIGVVQAVITSIRVTLKNPYVVGTWGVIVAAFLLLGSLPLFLGLIVVMPVLGHASWHLFRRAIEPIG
ncbi:MAG: DUF2189 domain-containing protein [Pseudomonadota bacterium]